MNRGPVLLVDDKHEGHHIFFLELVLQALAQENIPTILATTQKVADIIFAKESSIKADNITLEIIPGTTWGRTKPSLDDFRNLHSIISKHQPDYMLIMMLEGWISLLLQEYIRRAGRIFDVKWSTILIAPPVDLSPIGGKTDFFNSARVRFKEWVRFQAVKLILSAEDFRTIHLLDEFALEIFSSKIRHNKFKFLPDPVVESTFNLDYDFAAVREMFGITEHEYVFLAYGYHNRKKATPLLLRQFAKLLENKEYKNAKLIIAGPTNDPELINLLADPTVIDLIDRNILILDQRHLDQDQSLKYLQACDCVCVPYVNNLGTSGVLLRGLILEKQVISTDQNWMGMILKKEGLGILCQQNDGDSLLKALQQAFGTTSQKSFSQRDVFRSKEFQVYLIRDILASTEPSSK